MEPILPVELERKIFEMAYDPDDHLSNARLTMVAKRVYDWQVDPGLMTPMIYRVVDPEVRPLLKHEYCNERLASFVKRIFISVASCGPSVLWWLDHCKSIEYLFFVPYIYAKIEFNQRIRSVVEGLPNLTHLTILFGGDDWPGESLARFQRLTHLKIYVDGWSTDHAITICQNLPDRLRCLVILAGSRRADLFKSRLLLPPHGESVDPSRLVLFVTNNNWEDPDRDRVNPDWRHQRMGYFHHWAFMDAVLTCRQGGMVKPGADNLKCIHSITDWANELTEEGQEWFSSVVQEYDPVPSDENYCHRGFYVAV
ncbi:hypothetical protein BJ165DRAFT_1402149 [Panaeolus papilionaceus]|nr:hypothetical protein BJ165DRAFT_1402149 [Panaeolus papilionaceus]